MTTSTTSAPTWRCATLGCRTTTPQLHCTRHAREFEQLLDAVLADRRASATTLTTTAAHAAHLKENHGEA